MAKRKKGRRVAHALYWLRYRFGELWLRGLVRAFPYVPLPLLRGISAFGVRVGLIAAAKYRVRIEENVAATMGTAIRTPEQRKALAGEVWRNFAAAFLELAVAMFTTKEKILSTVRVEGEEHLERAYAKGKGIVALSGHLGNFMMIGVRLAAAGYPFNVVVKHPRDERMARLFDQFREWVGIKTISSRPRRDAARQVLKALRKNEIVLLIADEFKSGGVEVEFLGRKVFAQRGPATLAMRTGAPLLPVFVTRDANDRLTLYIRPEIELAATGNVQEDVDASVALFTRQLEEMVRRYPEQWSWVGFHLNGSKSRAEIAASFAASRDPTAPSSS